MTSGSSTSVLAVDNLVMRFGGLIAVNGLSFTAARGQITALIGPNGAGKTTVFNCLTGFYKPSAGEILLATETRSFPLHTMTDHAITRDAGVARTFQNIRLFSGMTVLENLIVAQHNALMKASQWTIGGLFGRKRYREAESAAVEVSLDWLRRIDLFERADDAAGSLPYGDQRRLEIARAMCTGPALLCLDEPAAGLNGSESAALATLIREIKAGGTSILLIEHDMSVVMSISDHVVVLDHGALIASGVPAAVRNDPAVIAAYLGTDDDAEATTP